MTSLPLAANGLPDKSFARSLSRGRALKTGLTSNKLPDYGYEFSGPMPRHWFFMSHVASSPRPALPNSVPRW